MLLKLGETQVQDTQPQLINEIDTLMNSEQYTMNNQEQRITQRSRIKNDDKVSMMTPTVKNNTNSAEQQGTIKITQTEQAIQNGTAGAAEAGRDASARHPNP